jgi:cold shock CspA family protein
MIWFNESKDHGFIRTDEGERLAVLGSGFVHGERPEGRCGHRPVTFEVNDSAGTRRAENVVFDREIAGRRARRRRGGIGARG